MKKFTTSYPSYELSGLHLQPMQLLAFPLVIIMIVLLMNLSNSTFGQSHQEIMQSVQDLSQKVQESSPKTVLVDRNVDPTQGPKVVEVLLKVPGKSYSGHLTSLFKPLSSNQPVNENIFSIYCEVPQLDANDEWFASFDIIVTGNSKADTNIDFSCLSLKYVIHQIVEQSGPVKVSSVIQYQISSDMKEIKDPIIINPSP